MKKIKILSLLFCVVMLVAACHDDEEGPIIPQPREQVGRTVLVYIVVIMALMNYLISLKPILKI